MRKWSHTGSVVGSIDEVETLVTTFSIVGYDPEEPAWGIAIASRFLAVGAQTCWGHANAGVVVLQAYLNARNGPEALQLLGQGVPAEEVIARLMNKDPRRHLRQMAIIDVLGRVAAYTGEACLEWAGHLVGADCAAQGNMLLGSEGCSAMVSVFESSKGTLARRLVNALTFGDEVAGDFRGRQASALYVVRPRTTEPVDVFTEPTIDLRVDDHENPFQELKRLLDLYELIYLPTAPEERLPQNPTNVRRLQRVLAHAGYYDGEISGVLDDRTRTAIIRLGRVENFHRRLSANDFLDGRLLQFLEAREATG